MKNYTEINVGALLGCYPNSRDNNIRLELENIDLSFIFNLEPEEIAHNCDLQKVLDYLDDDFIRQYITERFNIIM
jgi:hypothetical protein